MIPALKGTRALKDRFNSMKGSFNGAAWFIKWEHRQEVAELCSIAGIKAFDWPLEGTFEDLRKSNKTAFMHEKSAMTGIEIEALRQEFGISDLDEAIASNKKDFEIDPRGARLLELIDERTHLQENIKRMEEEARVATATKEITPLKKLLEPITEAQIAEELRNISPGVQTGYMIGDIDLKLPGGAISIIAAPTSHGKTTVCENLCLEALKQESFSGKSVYFFSYEEPRAAIVSNFLNIYKDMHVPGNNRAVCKSLLKGEVNNFECPIYKQLRAKKDEFFSALLAPGRLHIHYSDMTAPELIAAIEYLKANSNIGLVCIDYMQLLRMGGDGWGSRQEELKQICLMLKDCAVDTGLPIMLAAQFNRSVVCEADLSPVAIGEAGDIERIASFIVGCWNRNFEGFSKDGNKNKKGEKITKESKIYMEILKGRECGAGAWTALHFDGNSGKLKQSSKSSTTADTKNINL